MLTFALRRLLLALPVLLGVIFVVMLTIDLIPGDAVTLMLGEHATQEAVARVGSLFGLSMPVFWIGLVLIATFSLWLPWLPVGGAAGPAHLVLPAVTLALPSIAMVARMTRSSVLEVLREDYVRTARAKGLAERLVVGKHALRNAAIPILTLLGLQAGQLMGGAVLTETVFSWPGLGRLMIKAIFARDYVLLQGAVLVFALAFVVINLAVDLAYGALDPRIARQG